MTDGANNGGGVATVEPPGNKIAWEVFGWWFVVLVAFLIGGYFVAPEVPNSEFVSAAAVLTFVTTAAVGIERILEGAFALLGRSSGGWWPLKQVSGAIEAFEKNTNAYVAKPLADAIEELKALEAAAVNAGNVSEELQAEVEAKIAAYTRTRDQLQARLANLEKLAPGSPRFERANELADTATKTMDGIAETAAQLSGQLGDAILTTADTIAGAANRAGDIVASFSDNPARKVLSLMAGSILGIAVASLMGLNLFLAVLEDGAADTPTGAETVTDGDTDTGLCGGGPAACLDGRVGILVTGLIIGLGSNPTHEVIKALQRRRRNGDEGGDGDGLESVAAPAGGAGFHVLGVATSDAGPPAAKPTRRPRNLRSGEKTDNVESEVVAAGGPTVQLLAVAPPSAAPRAATPIRRRRVRSTD